MEKTLQDLLCASVPFTSTATQAIIWYADMLVIESGMRVPPFRPANYAPIRKVNEIRYSSMAIDGRIFPTNNGYFTIELNRNRSLKRQNFSLAHEISHTFFFEAASYAAQRHHDESHSAEEERLCDIAAAELLMPRASFYDASRSYTPSAKALCELCDLFETSLSATALRIAELKAWDSDFILWKLDGDRMKATWQVTKGRRFESKPQIDIVSAEQSSIYEALQTRRPVQEFEWLGFVDGFTRLRVDSLRVGADSVLSCVTRAISTPKGIKSAKKTSCEFQFDHECTCGGSGWISTSHNGEVGVTHCRASRHTE